MASAINLVTGDASSRPTRVIKATVDFAAITSYATGGHSDTVLDAELDKIGTSGYSMPMAAYNGSATRWFQVDLSTGKVKAYTTASLEAEVAAATNLSGYTAIPVLIFAE